MVLEALERMVGGVVVMSVVMGMSWLLIHVVRLGLVMVVIDGLDKVVADGQALMMMVWMVIVMVIVVSRGR